MGLFIKYPFSPMLQDSGQGYQLSYDDGESAFYAERGQVIMQSGEHGVYVDRDCVRVINHSEYGALPKSGGYAIGNAYDHSGDAGERVIYIEELQELDYDDACYVLVAEGADSLIGGDLVALGGKPRNFQSNQTRRTYCYVTYEGNGFEPCDDSVTVNSSRVVLFTGRMARRWLLALENNRFFGPPASVNAIQKYDFSVYDGLIEVSAVPVPNVYIADSIFSLADPNVLYEVPGTMFVTEFRLKNPTWCSFPFSFRFTMDNIADRDVVLYDETGNTFPVRWVSSRTVRGNKSYVLTVQGCVARLEEVLEVVN